MERKKGSYILNDSRIEFNGRAQAIHVLDDTTFTAIRDSRNQSASYYIALPDRAIKAGAVIAVRNGSQFTNISISSGSIEIIF